MSKKKQIKKLIEKVNRLLVELMTAYGDIDDFIKAYPGGFYCLDARFRHSNRKELEKCIFLDSPVNVGGDKKAPVYPPDSEGIYSHLASKEIKLHKVPETTTSTIPENEARIQRQTITDRQMLYGSPEGPFKSEFETSGQGFRSAMVTDKEKLYEYPKKSVNSVEDNGEIYKDLSDLLVSEFKLFATQESMDKIILASQRVVEKIDKIIEHNPEPDKGNFPCVDRIAVAERLYRYANSGSVMDVPSFVYENVERWFHEWGQEPGQTEVDFYNWCLLTKHNPDPKK